MQQNLLAMLKSGMPGFSKGQKRIANYIIEHYDKAAFMTAARLGKTAGVSESTVVRFAAELGFDGYPKLQKNLQEIIRSRLTTVQRLDIADGPIDAGNILTRVMNMDEERIQQTIADVSREEFDSTVDTIVKARRIYILGVRSSKLLAGFLAFYFNHIFDNLVDISNTSTSEVFEQIIHIGQGDVFIGFSFPRYSQRTIKAAAYAKSCGASIIGITDSPDSPIARYADRMLIAQSEMASFVDSLVAPLSLVNAMIVAVGVKKRAEVAQSYSKLEKIWSEYDVYEKNGDF